MLIYTTLIKNLLPKKEKKNENGRAANWGEERDQSKWEKNKRGL